MMRVCRAIQQGLNMCPDEDENKGCSSSLSCKVFSIPGEGPLDLGECVLL